jgi:hypothetical protein
MDKTLNVGAIMERLKFHFNLKTDTELASKLEMKVSTLSSWKGRNSFDANEIYSICLKYNINFHWLMTGSDYKSDVKTILVDSLNDLDSNHAVLEEELSKTDKSSSKGIKDNSYKNLEIELLRAKLTTIERLLKLIQ